MKLTKVNFLIAFFLLGLVSKAQTPQGELKRWHKVTLTFNGPNTTETSSPNPFTDYRLDVTFTHSGSNKSYTVPGYYAACGNAANNSCNSGNKWRVHFTPDRTGTWNWSASFKKGTNVAANGGGSGAGFMDGTNGNFSISESDKSGRDFRNKNLGRLQYVGEHYLKHSGTNPDNPNGPWFFKAGADSPENAFNYVDFDATPSFNNNLNKIGNKTWGPHQQDYNANDAGAYTWNNGNKGTEILGMLNYLAGQGANVVSFLTWNTDGDGGAVFPHVLKVSEQEYGNTPRGQQWNKVHKDRFDVSKLDQWEKVMEYADKKGIYLHFKTMETENDNKMDGNNFGRERKLYYREIIARFSHHLALNWNLTEETTLKDDVVRATAKYIKDNDPYDHNIVIHTYPGEKDQRYTPLLGNKSLLTGASLQSNQNSIHNDVKTWLERSRNSGRKWVVANDEQGSASQGVRVSDKQVRHRVLWATLLAGGAGVEYYSGYTNDDGDINGNDHRKRGNKYREGGYAINFFNKYLEPQVTKMVSSDGVTSDNNDYVFAQAGKIYAVYRPNGGSTGLNLPAGNGKYDVQWYNPRTGGNLTAKQTLGGSLVAPDNNDWVALITSKDGNGGGCDNTKVATASQDAYLQGTTKFNNADLRVESGKRVSYLKFTAPSTTEKVTSVTLELTVSTDDGSGLIEIFKGNSNNWTEANLSNSNKPGEGAKIGALNTTYSKGQSYQWNLSNIAPGETVSLIVKQTGGNDVSFSSKEGTNAPKLIFELECNDGGNDGQGNCDGVALQAITDFPALTTAGFSPAYKDNARNALAIDASKYKDQFAAVEKTFSGNTGTYDIKLTTLTEIDGESTYRISVDGVNVGEYTNPTTTTDYTESGTVFEGVDIKKGAKIRIEFNSHTNGKIPEGNSTAYSRGRWTALDFICQSNDGDNGGNNGGNCTADFEEKNGLVVMESENLNVSGTQWNIKTAKSGFTGNGYLSWDGNDAFGTPGNGTITVKVKINSPGKYRFQWRSSIGKGTNSTEHNDSWLRLPDANAFYGEKNGNRVYPKGSGQTPVPEGAGANGWFKIYLSGSTDWTWSTNTSDNDAHQIFAEFNSAGVYTIEVSGRSKDHLIDRIVMYKTGTPNPLNLSNQETPCTGTGTPPVSSIAIPGAFEAEAFKTKSGSVRIEDTPGVSGKNLGFIKNGDTTDYTVNITENGQYAIDAFASSNGTGGTIDIIEAGKTVGTITIPKTGQWHDYKAFSATVALTKGQKTLQLAYKGSAGFLFNIDKIVASKTAASSALIEQTQVLSPVQDAFLQGTIRYNQSIVRVEQNKRDGYLMFDLSTIPGKITNAQLKFTVNSDEGNGDLTVNKGNSNNWTEDNLSLANKPGKEVVLGKLNDTYGLGTTKVVDLDADALDRDRVSLILTATSGNDFAFGSKENKLNIAPQLIITYESFPKSGRFEENKIAVKAFPNPVKNIINVSGATNGSRVQLFNSTGILRREAIIKEGQNTIDVNNLPAGYYILNVLDQTKSNTVIFTKKIIKQ
ncbi:CBM96 family carbohydrate-binding protein [Aquimarina algicola]|uniref:DUF5060 domain-containing protein n=1 Tax=Aquimarina algicola TaxID=2589995 RepID=A0A504JGD7_9FLAO|nr:DUF5060 domain-containing protein [Aquimarina algicola]TPN87772.1 DUF5060 domain-containing protein [Aquimarina algicola]